MPKPTSVRLPKHISPSRYKLTLKPNLDDFTFSGEETIFLNLTKPTKTITLHAHGLLITDVFAVAGKQSRPAANISYDTKAETATFTFAKAIPAGKTNLTLKFTGIIADNLRGFYRSKYDHNGVTKHLGTTQFEATDARKAFPCFDEPAHKAIFDITFIVPEHHTVVSNTIEQSVQPHSDGFKIVQFAPTPKMSTYLVAYIIGELESVETTTKDGTIIRIFTTPGKSHEAAFALDTTKRCLEFFNEYFGIKYPLPVLDSIAVPDFSSGAMENWGAITYREQGLLFNDATGTILRKQYIAMVIAHELSHQWFGNLVTMEWWTHLWLNEGFASYITYVATDHLFPEWQVWTKFTTDDLAGALELDSLHNTHPVEIPVHHPSEIGEIFDAISYDKGACLLRMLSFYIGADKFRDSLRYYLKKHAYKNTQTEDLWAAFEHVTKKPVGKIMKTWTSKPGYPVIAAIPNKHGLKLTQQRYMADPKAKADNTVWGIPVQAQTGKATVSELVLLNKKSGELKLNAKTAAFVKLNPGEQALYRTAYHDSLVPNLVTAIQNGELNSIDRLGIIRDVFALNQSGQTSMDTVLTLVQAYQNDTSYIVWTEIAGGLWWIEQNLIGQAVKNNFRAFAHNLFATAVTRVGWEAASKETHTQTLLRALLIGQAGHYGHKPTITTALAKFRSHATGKQPLPPDLEASVYRIVAEQGSSKDYAAMHRLFDTATDIDVKQRLTNGLAQFKPTALAKKTLKLLLSDAVRPQDRYLRAYAFLIYNAENHQLLWDILEQKWPQVEQETRGTHLLTRVVENATHLITPEASKAFRAFTKKHPTPENKRAVQQTEEAITIRQLWLKRELKNLSKALAKIDTTKQK